MTQNSLPPLFWVRRSKRGRIKLTGRDRQSFLQGMVSNDIAALTPGSGCYAFMLQATGQVIGDMRVLCTPDYLLLDVEPEQAAFVCETLDKYLIMEKCRITDVSGETFQILVGGKNAPAFFQPGYDESPLEGRFYTENFDEFSETEGQNWWAQRKQSALVARTHLIKPPAFDVYLDASEADDLCGQLLAARRAEEMTEGDLEALRIAAGVPRFGVDIDKTVLAPETGQAKRAISYRKGCYIGQEIVARIHARGHTNRAFVQFVLPDGAAHIPPGATVSAGDDGANVGRITSVAPPFALGYVRHEFAPPGTPVILDGQISAHIAAPPPETATAETVGML